MFLIPAVLLALLWALGLTIGRGGAVLVLLAAAIALVPLRVLERRRRVLGY